MMSAAKGTIKRVDNVKVWFCEKCNHPLHSYKFPLENIERDFLPRFKEFYNSEELRTCNNCGHIMEADERFV
jgi:3-hydroxyanthranilate 3,4-dioxygenase